MKNLNFNTQICTTKEQSKRLLELGLNPNTADMHHYRWSEGYWDIQNCPPRGSNSNFIPAWSLHRLIAMLPDRDRYCITDYCDFKDHSKIYDEVISLIEWMIENGYFNKEYLKENKS